MKEQTKLVQFDEFMTNVPSIFEKVENEQKGVLVERDVKIFSLKMSKPKAKTRSRGRRSRGLTPDDSILGIIGLGRSKEPSNIARYKDQYLADAIADLHQE